jgi:prepilin-type N-terminal cleavage/methylation domain-containing protein
MRPRGLTLIEVLIATAVMSVLVLGVFSFQVISFTTYTEQQLSASVQGRARVAIDQIVTDLRKALTTGVVNSGGETSEFQTLYDNDSLVTLPDATGDTNSRGLFFREVVGATSSGPVFGAAIVVVGPHTGTLGTADVLPCAGIVRLRQFGLDMADPDTSFAALTSQGSDGVFGTFDDLTSATNFGEPEVRLLVPSVYAPQTGDMLRIDQAADPFTSGRTIRITMRLNYRPNTRADYQLVHDIVVQEDVALRQ